MILDFNTIPANAVPHFKGGEGEAIVRKFDDPRMGAVVRLTLPVGSSIGLHTHTGNCEVIYILSGSASTMIPSILLPPVCATTARRDTPTASSTPAIHRWNCWVCCPM